MLQFDFISLEVGVYKLTTELFSVLLKVVYIQYVGSGKQGKVNSQKPIPRISFSKQFNLSLGLNLFLFTYVSHFPENNNFFQGVYLRSC